MSFSAVDKDPNAVLDYAFEWADFLDGDTIATSDFPNFPAGITLLSEDNSDDLATIWLSGGTEDQDYRITNRITTDGGRTMDWLLVVRVTQDRIVPTGPPFANVREAISYTSAAEGADAMKVEMVLADAADILESIAPPPSLDIREDEVPRLGEAIDATQTTIQLLEGWTLPEKGTLLIDSEVVLYRDKDPGSSFSAGYDVKFVRRGQLGSLPATHTSGTTVREVGYDLRARRATLYIFEWLWATRGYIPSKSGVIGSESYSIGDEVLFQVRRIMGPYYGGRGGIRGVVPISTFRRARKSPYEWQRGGYDI